MECRACGNLVPTGDFCGACGARQSTSSTRRWRAFAANPSQGVFQPHVISTLFPHLPHRQGSHFRWALVLGAALLIVLGALRLTGPAIALAAAGIPLLYLLYLYDAEIYEDEPVRVVGLTFGLGLLLGIPWAFFTGPIVTHAVLHGATTGRLLDGILVAGVLIPLGTLILMLVGPVVLYVMGRYREPLDGFTFGAACALGFTFTTTLVNLAPELQRGLVSGATQLNNTLILVGRGLLIPFLNASIVGLVAGALWYRRAPTRTVPMSWAVSLPAAIVVAAVVRIAMGIVGMSVLRAGAVVAIYAVMAVLLLFWVRLAIHVMLLSEAEDAAVGPMLPCSHCHRVVPRMAFCPHCGIATGATPKIGSGRVRRGTIADGSGAEVASGSHPFEPAGREQIAGLSRPAGPLARWGTVGGTLLAGAVVLGALALALRPSPGSACRALCVPPPPPCASLCTHARPAPPLQTRKRYTSTAYGYSVEYNSFAPSQQNAQSVEWDLSNSDGQYSVGVVAGAAKGNGSQAIVNQVVNVNFPDFTRVYAIPGAEVGYTPGSGAVYEDESVPAFGAATYTRLVVLAAVRNGLAISVAGAGDASDPSSGADPSLLLVSGFIDTLANGTMWPGQTAR